jgi:hypothetical protein
MQSSSRHALSLQHKHMQNMIRPLQRMQSSLLSRMQSSLMTLLS